MNYFEAAKAITRAAFPQNAKDAMIEDAVSAQEFPWVTPAPRTVAHGHIQGGDDMKVYNESKYLKHQDLEGNDWVVTVKNVTREDIKDRDGTSKKKFIVHFNEVDKGLVLNTTNMNTLYKLFQSDDSDDWTGKRITLFCKDDIEMGGEIMSGIRIRAKLPL